MTPDVDSGLIDTGDAAAAAADALVPRAVDALPLNIAVIDSRGRIIFENAGWRDFGARRGGRSTVGTSYIEVCERAYGESRPRALEIAGALERILAGELREFRCDYSMTSADETTHWTVHFSRFEIGRTLRVVCSHSDITARERARRELEASRAEAERANRANRAYLAALTHDVRNPLHAILGFADLVAASAELPEALRPDLRMVGQAASRLLELVNRILELSELENDAWTTASVATSADDLLEELRVLHSAALDRSRLRLVRAVLPTVPPVIELDLARTRRLLGLLLENAIGAAAGSEVRLTADFRRSGDVDGELAVSVSAGAADPPLPAADARPDRTSLSIADSTGAIGRALAEALAHRLGGTIDFSPDPTRTARATVRLPVRLAPADSGAVRSSSPPRFGEPALAPGHEPADPTLAAAPEALDEATLDRLDRAAAVADIAALEAIAAALAASSGDLAARLRRAIEGFDYADVRHQVAALRPLASRRTSSADEALPVPPPSGPPRDRSI